MKIFQEMNAVAEVKNYSLMGSCMQSREISIYLFKTISLLKRKKKPKWWKLARATLNCGFVSWMLSKWVLQVFFAHLSPCSLRHSDVSHGLAASQTLRVWRISNLGKVAVMSLLSLGSLWTVVEQKTWTASYSNVSWSISMESVF